MADGKFVAYYRVSTQRQGASGLGLEAQQKAVRDHLNGGNWELIDEIQEIESGKQNDRPALQEALRKCRLYNAKLIIAKLDRLSRDAHFLLGLQKGQVPFVAADMPDANEMTVGIMAVIAEAERKMISNRTKAALEAAKARGVTLGGYRGFDIATVADKGTEASAQVRKSRSVQRAADVMEIIKDLKASGATSLRSIAKGLNERGIKTPRGSEWQANSVKRVIDLVTEKTTTCVPNTQRYAS